MFRFLILSLAMLLAPIAHAGVLVIDSFDDPLVLLNPIPVASYVEDTSGFLNSRRAALYGQGWMTTSAGSLLVQSDGTNLTASLRYPADPSGTSPPLDLASQGDALQWVIASIVGDWSISVLVTDSSGVTESLAYGINPTLVGIQPTWPFIFSLFRSVDCSSVVSIEVNASTYSIGSMLEVKEIIDPKLRVRARRNGRKRR